MRYRAFFVPGLFGRPRTVVRDPAVPMPFLFENMARMAGGAAASGIWLGTPEPRDTRERPFIGSARGGNQKPARPCGLLYGIWTLVTSLSEPSGCVA